MCRAENNMARINKSIKNTTHFEETGMEKGYNHRDHRTKRKPVSKIGLRRIRDFNKLKEKLKFDL